MKLWKKNAIGIGWWEIEVLDDVNAGIITITHAVTETAAPIAHVERIAEGKNIGRANETNPVEQAVLEAISRVSKQRDKGYVEEKPHWSDAVTNQLGQLKPMLAQPLDKVVKHLDFEHCFIQPKLDGFRCLAHRGEGDQLIMYTRNGKKIDTLPHIADRLLQIMKPGDHFDGELYLHGTSLQTIASWVKRAQEDSVRIEYHVYDMVILDDFYPCRLDTLNERFDTFLSLNGIVPLPNAVVQTATQKIETMAQAQGWFKYWREIGFEGAILRWGLEAYEDGKRSKHLVKLKKFIDEEFEVVDIVPGKTTSLNGNEVTPGIAICKMLHGQQFRCPLPGELIERQEQLYNKELYVGKQLTVKFANLTPDGVPFHPVGLRWRLEL
jgi:DNA ligase-1